MAEIRSMPYSDKARDEHDRIFGNGLDEDVPVSGISIKLIVCKNSDGVCDDCRDNPDIELCETCSRYVEPHHDK